jgi:hypothetical protein
MRQLTARAYKSVSLVDVLNMQPFEATVEDVSIEHYWFFKPDVSINLKRNDNAKRLSIEIIGATELGLKLADEFHQGSSYAFPKVITDFFDAQNAKTVK